MGDPSGRTKERDKLQTETLEKNLKGLSKNLSRVFHNYEHLVEKNAGSPLKYKIKPLNLTLVGYMFH